MATVLISQPDTRFPSPDTRFDPNNSKYKCCCDCCHVKTGCIVIGTLEALGCLTSLVTGLAFGYIILPILCALFSVLFLVVFFVGLSKQKAVFLIPHMVFQVLQLVGVVAGLIELMVYVIIQALAMQDNQYYDNASSAMIGLMVGLMIALLLVFALQIWFFTIVLACYRYFKAVEAQLSAHENTYNDIAENNPQPQDYPPYPNNTY